MVVGHERPNSFVEVSDLGGAGLQEHRPFVDEGVNTHEGRGRDA